MKTPFTINVEASVLDDLSLRLSMARWPDEPEYASWDYGTNLSYLKELVEYWKTSYDWREQERKLNELPQYTTTIDGHTIHFVYQKGKGESSKPLLLTHGWPDSFIRYSKVLPKLTDPAQDGAEGEPSFDVIIPSIPGFGFSERMAMNTDEVAVLWQKLMTEELGYTTYLAAGGDLGSNVTKSLANQYPDSVKAIHLTDVGYPTGQEENMTEAEQAFAQEIQQWWMTEGAYNMIQSTKPQTLSYGLNDSPIGLAAWITEKFYTWSDSKGLIENSFTKDEVINNIMIYWITQTISTSVRMYREEALSAYTGTSEVHSDTYVETPTAVASFPADAGLPEEFARRKVNLQRYTAMKTGGHFGAWERPNEFVYELREFFKAY